MASKLITGGTIISFDTDSKSLKTIRNGSLLVTAGKIAGIYEQSASVDIPKDTERIDATGKIITPGFVDTHRHGWQTAFKTLGANTTLAEYFQLYGQFVPAAAENFTPEDIYVGELAGLYEALNAGVTTMLDHAHGHWEQDHADAGVRAAMDSGARVFWGYAFHHIPKGWAMEDQLTHYRTKSQDAKLKQSLVSLGIAYDGFCMGDDGVTEKVATLAKETDAAFLTCHALGGPWTFYNSPALIDKAGMLRTQMPVVISHASFITAEDADLLRQTNQYISTTPESEAHYGHDNPETESIQDQASLGIDTHYTFSTDILTQSRLWLQHLRQSHFRQTLQHKKIPLRNPMQVSQAFLLATRAGGLALRRPDLGVISEGAAADLCFFDGDSPSLLGWHDPVAAVILHANVGDISDVLVHGEFVKRRGKIVAPGYTDVKERFLKSARRLQEVWIEMGRPDLKLGDKFLGVTEYGDVKSVETERRG